MAKRIASTLVRGLADPHQGTHLCQFYKSKKELLDVLVPFFKAGIESNEFCLWIASSPISSSEAWQAIREALPDNNDLLTKGQLKVLDHSAWYTQNGVFDVQKSSEAFINEIRQAMSNGYSGVRLATNLSWLDKKDWHRFTEYEDRADKFVRARPMRVICAYPLGQCGAMDVIDIVRNHHSVIVKQNGKWQLVKSSGHRMIGRLLKETERKYEHLFANALDGVLVFDVETMKVVLANQAAATITGFASPDEMTGADLVNSVPDEARDRVATLLADALSRGQSPLAEDLRITARDGRELWVNGTCKRIDYQGKDAGLVTFREITDRKRAEERLLASQERNRLLIENANEAIVVIQDEVIKFANPKTEELFGFAAQELVLKPVADIIHPEERQTVMAQHFKRLNGEEVPQVHQFRIVDRAGNTRWVELNGVLLSWGGRPADLCFVRDITQRKLAEERLQDSYQKLEDTLQGVIQAMAQTVEIRDRCTAGHQRRVTELAQAIARELGLSKQRVRALLIAGLLHDLGKITIPTEILSKPGRLTDMEWAIIRTHPEAGYDILKSIEFPWPVADIVVQHHERMDGSGYPLGLVGDQCALEARILAVADVVEAMSSHRPYRPAPGVDKALNEIITNRGRLYDPKVVDVCLTLFNQGLFRFADQGI